jgi:hypothetical protein
LLFGSLQKGGVVLVDVDKDADKLVFKYQAPPALPPASGEGNPGEEKKQQELA